MTERTRSGLASAGALVAAVALALWLLTPFCGLLHRCGCTFVGLGAEARCNVWNATGPHCPWCEHRALAGAVAAAIVAGQAGTFALQRRSGRGRLASGAAALASFPLVGTVAGALAWAPTDYPHFLALDARAALHLPEGPIPCHGRGVKAGCCAEPPR